MCADCPTPVPSLPPLALPDGEVHVWHALLDKIDLDRFDCESLLSDDERQRAARFRFARDRRQAVQSRALLRLLLQSYGVAPARELRFVYSTRGKPALDPARHSKAFQFSLAHSGGLVLYGMTRAWPVGVDAELLREVTDADRIVERYFSAAERAEYRACAAAERQRAFFNGWVRKEAFVKATGEGLSRPLHSFSVRLASGVDVDLRVSDPNADALADWRVFEVLIDPRYTAALAVHSRACTVRLRELTIDVSSR